MRLPILFICSALFLSGCAYVSAPQSNTCKYNDQTYTRGEQFEATDSCNICTCDDNGRVMCTTQYCPTNPAECKQDIDCEKLDIDESFCTDGNWTCVDASCEFQCDISGML